MPSDRDDSTRGPNQPPDDRHIDPSRPLPAELNPRGRRAGRKEMREFEARQDEHADQSSQDGQAAPEPISRSERVELERQQRQRRPLNRGLLIGVRVAAALLSLLVVVGGGWAWATYRNFTADIRRVDAISTPTGKNAKTDIDGKAQNILVVGNDDRDSATDAELKQLGTTRDGGSYNTDTMMLLHVPANGGKATVISFPRDSYVSIPGHGMNKLNAAYPLGIQDAHGDKAGGARLLINTIQQLTGLHIDHFVQVDLLGFYRISNAIGGVQVCLINAQKERNSGINLPAGFSTIKGKQALAFVRQREGLPNGDLDRIKRQQYFLSAAFRKLTSAGTLLNPLKLRKLLKAVSDSLQMDQTLDPLQLAQQFSNISAGKVTFSTIPTDGFANVDVGSVVVVHPGQIQDWVDKMVGVPQDPALQSAPKISPSKVTVAILNGSNRNLAAGTAATTLRGIGFKVASVGDADSSTDTTKIEYATGMESAAKTLAAHVPGASVVKRNVEQLTLVLGTDGVAVKAASAPSSTPTPSKPAATRPPGVSTAADAGCIN